MFFKQKPIWINAYDLNSLNMKWFNITWKYISLPHGKHFHEIMFIDVCYLWILSLLFTRYASGIGAKGT